MKKILAILLLCILTISTCSAAFAADISGTLLENRTEFTIDFSTFTKSNGKTVTIKDTEDNAITFNSRQTSNALEVVSETNTAPGKAIGEKYVVIGSGAETGAYQRLGFGPAIANIGDGEKLRVSFDLKNDDTFYNKNVFFAKTQNLTSNSSSRPVNNLVSMRQDQTIAFAGLEDAPTMLYDLGRWYHFDAVFDYTPGANGLPTVTYYMDGSLVGSTEQDLRDTTKWNFSFFGFCIYNTAALSDATQNPTLCVDDISMKIYGADEQVMTGSTIFEESFDSYQSGAVSGISRFSFVDGGAYAIDAAEMSSEDKALFVGLRDGAASTGALSLGMQIPSVSADTIVAKGQLYLGAEPSEGSSFTVHGLNAAGSKISQSFDCANDLPALSVGSWMDFRYTCNFAEKTLRLTFDNQDTTVPLDGDMTKLCAIEWAPVFDAEAPGYFALNSIRVYRKEKIGSITEIGESGVADYNEPVLTFSMDVVPPMLTKDTITVTSDFGSVAVTGIEINAPTVTCSLERPLMSGTEYRLTVLQAAFGDSEDAEDVSAPFRTELMEFDVSAPSVIKSGDTAMVSVMVYNNTLEPHDLTLLAVSYYNGKLQKVRAASLRATAPETLLSISGIESAEGWSVKLFPINGWSDKTPLFNKNWVVNY